MKKIKNMRQLKAQKQQLLSRRVALEKAIEYDWRDLKESIRPKNITSLVLSKMLDNRYENNTSTQLADNAAALAATITRKLMVAAKQTLGKWLHS
jgi:hypothetical protein